MCKQAITEKKFVTIEGKNFHTFCFVCTHCQSVLDFNASCLVEDGTVTCQDCFNDRLAPKCKGCGRGLVGKFRVIDELGQYHEECFTCSKCFNLLGNELFYNIDGGPVCEACINSI